MTETSGNSPSERSIRDVDSKLDILTEQIGRLTEGLTEIRVSLTEIRITAQAQAESISSLVARANRQASIIEQLLARRGEG